MYQNFIGIDIGKAEFYVANEAGSTVKSYANTALGIKEFYTEQASLLHSSLVVLETTGGYEMALIRFLLSKDCSVHRANTRKVKSFIRSYGQLGKSDSIDAKALARYGCERHTSLALYSEHFDRNLLNLVNRQSDIKRMLVQEKNRLQAPEQGDLCRSYEAIIEALNNEIAVIEAQIDAQLKSNPFLEEQKQILKTVSGIGDIISIQLLALLPELGKVNRKQIASLSGLAPHPNESGQKIGYRRTRGGRSTIKPVLFMAAMSASRGKTELGEAYRKFIKMGKKKMVALTAIMRKIVVIANARMRDFYIEQGIIKAVK